MTCITPASEESARTGVIRSCAVLFTAGADFPARDEVVNLPALPRPRSLRHCVIATVAAGFLLLTASQYFVAGEFIEHQLLKVESEDGFTHLRNLHHGVDQLGEDLALTTIDWAQWDAAYEYTTGKRPQFVSDNLNARVLEHLRLNFLIVVDEHGRAAFAQSLSDDGSERDLEEWVDREIFSAGGHMEVVSQSDDGRSWLADYRNDTYGQMRTSWGITVDDGRITRFETGQA